MPDALKTPRAAGPRVNVRGAEGAAPPPRAAAGAEEVLRVPVSIVEALLGGRIPVDTPQGRVHVTLPPCKASDGARVRVRGKAADGGDLLVELRVVLPASLDDESRALIERFAELNPYDPREPR
jgi:DnaJ-class molecular chaperone